MRLYNIHFICEESPAIFIQRCKGHNSEKSENIALA